MAGVWGALRSTLAIYFILRRFMYLGNLSSEIMQVSPDFRGI